MGPDVGLRRSLCYDELPAVLLGSPGALGRFRGRPMIDPSAVFGFMVAGVTVLLAIGWLRRLIAATGPE